MQYSRAGYSAAQNEVDKSGGRKTDRSLVLLITRGWKNLVTSELNFF